MAGETTAHETKHGLDFKIAGGVWLSYLFLSLENRQLQQ